MGESRTTIYPPSKVYQGVGEPGENSLGGLLSFSVGEHFYPSEVRLKLIG